MRMSCGAFNGTIPAFVRRD